MSLGDCTAPWTVVGGWWVVRHVDHGLISPLGPLAWGQNEVWSRSGKGSMGAKAQGPPRKRVGRPRYRVKGR